TDDGRVATAAPRRIRQVAAICTPFAAPRMAARRQPAWLTAADMDPHPVWQADSGIACCFKPRAIEDGWHWSRAGAPESTETAATRSQHTRPGFPRLAIAPASRRAGAMPTA